MVCLIICTVLFYRSSTCQEPLPQHRMSWYSAETPLPVLWQVQSLQHGAQLNCLKDAVSHCLIRRASMHCLEVHDPWHGTSFQLPLWDLWAAGNRQGSQSLATTFLHSSQEPEWHELEFCSRAWSLPCDPSSSLHTTLEWINFDCGLPSSSVLETLLACLQRDAVLSAPKPVCVFASFLPPYHLP